MADPILEVTALAVDFHTPEGIVPAVREVDLSIEPGCCLALVGESGSGKSVTALALLGLVPKPGVVRSGRVEIDSTDVLGLEPDELRDLRGRLAGMIFQEPMTSLNPVFTVGFHLAEALTSHGKLPKDQVRERSIALLTEVGIPDPERRLAAYPHQLSGGLRQRVMIACAIAMNPKLIIADEPTTALDVTVEAQIMRLLDRLRQSHNAALLLVTHDLGLVARHADDVAVMYAGYVVERAGVTELFDEPRHPYTRALMGSMPGGIEGERLSPIPGNVPHPLNVPSGCPFRDRCELAFERCAGSMPPVTTMQSGATVRCFKVDGDG